MRKAIALLSGGLDSALAAALVQAQGVKVIGLHYYSVFGCQQPVDRTARELGIPVICQDKGAEFLRLVESPRFGYGRNMNPCVDCRIQLFRLALSVMEQQRAQFIVTGEVLGQRPMSQLKHSMRLIDRFSETDRKILRPLSSAFFPKTEAEEKGWIDASQFPNISGRGRKDQIRLAKQFGLTQFTSPGGGCLLTEERFSQRVRDFFYYDSALSSDEKMARAEILRYGRHLRISEQLKVVVARNNNENHALDALHRNTTGVFFEPRNFRGPVAIAYGEVDAFAICTVARIIARYGKPAEADSAEVTVTASGQSQVITVSGLLAPEDIRAWLI